MEQDRNLRTRFAIKALDLAQSFKATFDGFALAGQTNRTVVLTVPEGQSTGGGAAANQSISLVPEDRMQGILIAGTVHGGSLTAELRGFPYIRETYRLRYHGKPVDFKEADYVALLEKAKACLEMNGYTVTLVNQLPQAAKQRMEQQAAPRQSSAAPWIILVLVLAAGAAAAVYYLFR